MDITEMSIIDKRGDIIVMPKGYDEALDSVRLFIDSMRDSDIEIADIRNVMWAMINEIDFHIRFNAGKK